MEKKQTIWGFLAIGYFFLGALGAMTFFVGSLLDLFGHPWLGGPVAVFAVVTVGLGALMLLAELGQKFRFLLVFTRPSSIMSLGAWFLGAFLVLAVVYASFFFDFFPWASQAGLRQAVGVLGMIFALLLVLYPALELGEARGRSFWHGAGLAPLFLVNALSSGIAAVVLLAAFFGAGLHPLVSSLSWAFLALTALDLIFIFGYVLGMRRAPAEEAKKAAEMVWRGDFKFLFWGGIVAVGHILPWLLYLVGQSPALLEVRSLLFILGSLFLRQLILQAGVRVSLPGEENEWEDEAQVARLAAELERTWQERAGWISCR